MCLYIYLLNGACALQQKFNRYLKCASPLLSDIVDLYYHKLPQ